MAQPLPEEGREYLLPSPSYQSQASSSSAKSDHDDEQLPSALTAIKAASPTDKENLSQVTITPLSPQRSLPFPTPSQPSPFVETAATLLYQAKEDKVANLVIEHIRTGHLGRGGPELPTESVIEALDQVKGTTWYGVEPLLAALHEGNLPWIQRLLPLATQSPLNNDTFVQIYQMAMRSINPDCLSLLLESSFPTHRQLGHAASSREQSFSALDIALNNSNEVAVRTILTHPKSVASFSTDELKQTYQRAIHNGDLDCAAVLSEVLQYPTQSVALDMLTGVPGSELSTDLDVEQIKARVCQIGYFSSQTRFQQWLGSLAELIADKPAYEELWTVITAEAGDLHNWLPYVARYVREEDIVEMGQYYQRLQTDSTTRSEFVIKQKAHAELMRLAVTEQAQTPYSTLRDSQLHYATRRAAQMKDRSSRMMFARERSRQRTQASTAICETSPPTEELFPEPWTFQGSRYLSDFAILHHMMHTEGKPAVVGLSEQPGKRYTLYYASEVFPGEIYPLTQVTSTNRWEWHHTDPNIITRFWGDAEKVTDELMRIPIDPADPGSREAFKQLWLKAYWLSSNFCLFARGSAQYTQNSLIEICQRKGMPAPISRKEYPMLNTVAISLPLEDFLARADEFLEPWT